MTRKILFVDRAVTHIASVAADILNGHYTAKGIDALVLPAGFSEDCQLNVPKDLCSNADVIAYTESSFHDRLHKLAPRSTLVHVALPDGFRRDYTDSAKADTIPADEMRNILAAHWKGTYGKRVLEKTLGTYADELSGTRKAYPQIDPASLQNASL